MNEVTYKKLYPTGANSPKFYGLPKVHKQGMPLRPIISSIEAVTYQSAKELSKTLKPLVGKSSHHVHKNEDSLQHLKGIQLGPDEVIISYDVKALFTSVPIQPALTIIEKLLEEDPGLHEKTSNDSQEHHLSSGILPQEHLLHLPEPYIMSRLKVLPWALPSAQ